MSGVETVDRSACRLSWDEGVRNVVMKVID